MGSDEFSYIIARQEANDETEQPGGCHNEGFLEGGVACQQGCFFRKEVGDIVFDSCFHFDSCFFVDVAKIGPLQ